MRTEEQAMQLCFDNCTVVELMGICKWLAINQLWLRGDETKSDVELIARIKKEILTRVEENEPLPIWNFPLLQEKCPIKLFKSMNLSAQAFVRKPNVNSANEFVHFFHSYAHIREKEVRASREEVTNTFEGMGLYEP